PVCLYRYLSVSTGTCLSLQIPVCLYRYLSVSTDTCLFPQVCSGWSQVTWRFPPDFRVDGVFVDSRGSSSVLQLVNVTWRNSGRYTCEEEASNQSRDINIFIPGQGSSLYLSHLSLCVVMKEAEEDTIPCVVSNPRLNVSLLERPSRTPVDGLTYEPGRGFTGRLNDTSYVCSAAHGDEERESQVYYVFIPQVMEVDLSVSSSVLKQGEVLTVNCTVKDTEMVFFTWDFPRRQVPEIEPLTDFLPNRIRSFVNISTATVADSGKFLTTKVTHLSPVAPPPTDRGYVYLWASGETHLSTVLHQSVQFSVEVDAHPPPLILWTGNNRSVATETSSIITTHLRASRYVSTLTLVRVQLDQTGSYTVTASNDDDVEEVVFYLQVEAPPRITSLSEVGGNTVLCVSEGSPPPSVTWYTCHSSQRMDGWMNGWMDYTATVYIILQYYLCNPLRLSAALLSQVSVLSAVLVLVVIAIVFLVLLIVLWRKKPRYEVRWKVIESVSPDGTHYTYLDPAHLPYCEGWEVPRNHVVLGQVLGSGAFGCVVEATISGLIHSHSTTKAAVKMVKRTDAVPSLMSELKVLVHLGPHLNVVNLLGACTRGGPFYLITELCPYGDLANYLQRNKHTFLQGDTVNRSVCLSVCLSLPVLLPVCLYLSVSTCPSPCLIYPESGALIMIIDNCCPSDQQEASSLLLSDSPQLSLSDLIGFSYQISQAMDFLSSRKCVHRPSSEERLVCEGKLVKVCDFGLARDLLKNQNYIARGTSFLPLKWMSPEASSEHLQLPEDVWSYGVLLWEIFSLGSSPYPDLPMTQEFYSALKRGYRMNRPEHASLDIYCDVMLSCCVVVLFVLSCCAVVMLCCCDVMLCCVLFASALLQLTEDFLKGQNPAVVRSDGVHQTTEDQTDRQTHTRNTTTR
uniref:receptor protein-tyrosine kinase n=1 Tax=Amphiprion percula TaxID=161767 RepID=A0A3P8RY41_AMPPE